MNRCAITRKDGVVRIGILCDHCSESAARILMQEARRFWAREYKGPEPCEACYMDAHNTAIEAKET